VANAALCPLLAQSGHPHDDLRCALLEVKRTFADDIPLSACALSTPGDRLNASVIVRA